MILYEELSQSGAHSQLDDAAQSGFDELGLLGDFLQVEHFLLEAAAIEASLVAGIVVTGFSVVATGLAGAPVPETGGLGAALLPFTLSGVAAGGFLLATGVSGNIDILNTVLDPFFGRVIPNPFHGVPEIPRFPVFSGEHD